MPWSMLFEEPIILRGGVRMITLQHAADYIMKLPDDVQQQERWQIAVENLINAAESGGGWLMFARIGMMRALNADEQEPEAAGQSPLLSPSLSPNPPKSPLPLSDDDGLPNINMIAIEPMLSTAMTR